jgi:phosphoglycerate dehydrogenase-like enzyme
MTSVLFLVAAEGASPDPWLADVRREAEGRLELRVAIDEGEADFSEVQTVIDVGGWASDAAIDRGADAGVELWQVLGYGLDHINVDHVHKRGITLAHTPGAASAVALAEHAMCLMLAVEKHLFVCRRNVTEEVFGVPLLGELSDQELLIIGYGASGRELGRRAAAFGMRISAADLEAPDDPMLARSGRAADLSGILEHADFVSLHLPISVETTHLVDAAFLRRMKRTAVLINVARGRLVDERALIEALRAGTLRGAGLDVFESEPLRAEHPLQSFDNVVLTPHVAGMTRSTSRRRAAIAVENALLVADGRPAKYVVASPA